MRTARVFLITAVSAGLLFAAESPAPRLTAEQSTHAEDLYWKVMARCCIRKPGAAKIHQQIEKQVVEGKSDQAILADFSARYGGGPVNLDRVEQAPPGANWMLLPPLGVAMAAGIAVGFRRLRARKVWRGSMRPPRQPPARS